MDYMDDVLGYQQRILEEWRHFQNGEAVDGTVVRECVLRSWQRCRKKNVDPYGSRTKALPPHECRKAQAENAFLMQSARMAMDQIWCMISGSQSTMVLASKEGVVLHMLPGDVPESGVGCISREEIIGTAGIATCLEERKQIEIFGAEHFCASRHNFVCAAAPITSAKGEFVGVLGITSPFETYHPHTSGMLKAGVYAISEQLGLRELLDEQNTLMEMLDEGVIVADAQHVIRSINRKAMDILGFKESPLGRQLTSAIQFSRATAPLIKAGTAFHDVDTVLQQGEGVSAPCVVSAAVNPSRGGMILTMRETRRMREFANRITGARALFTFSDILGDSQQIRKAVTDARRIAEADITVLLLGESGTGKELFAQSIHNAGPRKGKPFVVVNCGALPHELVQSELFGYTEGAFTGASRQGNPGKFELADGGTIFLDEIGEMPLDVQVNLLRLLQNKEVTRVGGKTSRIVDVRIIAATNRDLQKAVRERAFRADLYYRLNVFPINIPPLRERQGDVERLARFFLGKFRRGGASPLSIAPEALEALKAYLWPGNIRELENVLERSSCTAAGPLLTLHDLPQDILNCTEQPAAPPPPETPAENEEQALFVQALRANRGRIQPTIESLNITRSTFYYKLKQYGIRPADFRRCGRMKPVEQDPPYAPQSPLAALSTEQLEALAELAKQLSATR